METVKLLEKQFTGTGEVKGFEFCQIKESVSAYLYKVKANGQIHYETFKRLKSPVCLDFNKRIYSDTDFAESYPKSKAFGSRAWTFKKLSDAESKFNEISEQKNQ